MEDALHSLDPNGDVMLTLRKPNAPFAVWDDSPAPPSAFLYSEPTPAATDFSNFSNVPYLTIDESEPPSPSEIVGSPLEDIEAVATLHETEPIDTVESAKQELEVRFRVSSKHLILACGYFEKQLTGPWKDSSPTSDGYYYTNAEDWDCEALLLLLRIIHGRNKSVPQTISLDMLTKIAVLVDFYQCHEAVHIFSKIWLAELKNQVPTVYDRDLVLWLSTSSVFLQTDILLNASKTAVRHARGPLSPLGLPIRWGVIEAIESWRKQYMGRLISRLNDRLLKLRSREAECCSFECQSMSLGALTIEMSQAGLLQPRPQTPYFGQSIAATINMVRGFKTPRWLNSRSFGKNAKGTFHTCDSLSAISVVCQEIEDAIARLTFEDFQPVIER